MINTPETDLFDSKWDSYSNPWEAIQLARKLEQERDEARVAIRALAEHGESEIQRITKERDEALDESLEQARLLGISAKWGCRIIAERNEAREALKHIGEYGTEEINAAVELRQKLASALVERDEAIESRKKWEKAAFDLFDLCEERRGK